MTDNMRDHVRRSFEAQAMMTTLGAQMTRIDEADVEITAPILPGSLQQQGYGHAGLTFSIGDSAAGYAALTTLPQDMEVLTAEMKINLLAPSQGDFLRAIGRVIKPGKRLIVVAADVHAITGDEQVLIAVLQGTMVPVRL